jgi:Uma2 family endonuclease
MPVMVLDPTLESEIIEGRNGFSRSHLREEVWEGVTYIMPEPDADHFRLTTFFIWVFRSVFDPDNGDLVGGPTNVSDGRPDWTKNYRVPDCSIFLAKHADRNRFTHWSGGPDLAVEIISPNDYSRKKLEFYATVGTGEVLVVDRDPWQLELYRLADDEMRLVGTVKPSDRKKLVSQTTPFSFQLLRGRPRPKIRVTHTASGQEWVE